MLEQAFKGLELWRRTNETIVRRKDGESDLSMRQTAVLLDVYLTTPPHTVGALAERLNISKPAVSRAVDRLSVLGLLERRTDANDRRVIHLEPTKKGAVYVRDLGDIIEECLKENAMPPIYDNKGE